LDSTTGVSDVIPSKALTISGWGWSVFSTTGSSTVIGLFTNSAGVSIFSTTSSLFSNSNKGSTSICGFSFLIVSKNSTSSK